MPELEVIEEDLRFKFFHRGRFGLAYNKGHLGWGDFHLSRPNFFPVYTPSGLPVTTNVAYRYNHHRSIFIGHAKVNGVNFFHDNNPTRNDLGDIALERADTETTETQIRLHTQNAWIKKPGERMLTEQREIVWTPGETVHILDVTSILISDIGEVTFGQDKHAFFGIRVADTIDVEDGGRILNSNGAVNEEEAMDQLADWVDYSGTVGGRPCGVTLMTHPSNPPSPFFCRNYGTILANFTSNGSYVLADGDSLIQRFRVLLHDGPPEEIDIAAYHRAFATS